MSCAKKSALRFSEESPSLSEVQIRLLNADEYKNSVHDILNVEVSQSVRHSGIRTGYDTSAENQMNENLLDQLATEGLRIAEDYFDQRVASQFGCFESNLTETCALEIIYKLGSQFFRRTLSNEMKSSLRVFYARTSKETQSVRNGLELTLASILSSPYFLYRTESGGGGNLQLDSFERASLLSFALSGSTPDESLLRDAEKGMLSNERMIWHARRLLNSERGKAQLVKFFKQWLRVSDLDYMVTHLSDYPKFESVEQALSLRDEFEKFVLEIVMGNEGTLKGLLSEPITFVNRWNAKFYNSDVNSNEMVKIHLDSSKRGGILTLASVMSVHSSRTDPSKDRPVVRGTLLKNQLFCEEVGSPSGIDTTRASEEAAQKVSDFELLSVREQFEAMMQQGQKCLSCHQIFMPLGYALGNFNALGAYVTERNGRVIDTSISNFKLDGKAVSYQSPIELLEDISNSERVSLCFVKQFLKYVTGRSAGRDIDEMTTKFHLEFKKNNFNIVELFETVFGSEMVYQRRRQ